MLVVLYNVDVLEFFNVKATTTQYYRHTVNSNRCISYEVDGYFVFVTHLVCTRHVSIVCLIYEEIGGVVTRKLKSS